MVDMLQPEDGVLLWASQVEMLRDTLLTEGWSSTAGAFTQALGSAELDAAALMLPLVGFLPANHPKVRSTIDAIEAVLVDDRGLVRRYLTDSGVDGVSGDEGSFLICTFWLAQALASAGEVDRARAYFDRACGYANDLGLMAEEVETRSGRMVGNFPQAFSHVGLVHAARELDQAARAQLTT